MKRHVFIAATILAVCRIVGYAEETEVKKVTIDTFIRAESDMYFKSYVDQDGFGKFQHLREPTPIDKQDVIRMNRDTLYSIGVFDLAAGPVTIHKPDTGERFQSLQVINQDHYTIMVVYEPGKTTLTQEQVGTRYVVALVRTLVDAENPEDIKKVNALQDQTTAHQQAVGTFEIPNWDNESRNTIRKALNVLAATVSSTQGMFGSKDQVDPVHHLLGTAYGWGGNPLSEATYLNVVPEKNDGKTPYTLTVKDVPVKGFWSITVYNREGFMEKNDQNSYSFNNVTAKKNEDGSVTINFGRGAEAMNNIPITPGWNYIVRLYRPEPEILDGKYTFPAAMLAE